MGSLYNTS